MTDIRVTLIEEAVAEIVAERDAAQARESSQGSVILSLTNDNARLLGENEALRARNAELEALLAPPPAPARLFVGGCPTLPNGTPQQVVSKWGQGAAVRTFSQEADGWNVPARPEGAGIWHHSWKPPLGLPVFVGDVADSLQACQDGDIVSVWHETPTKYRAGKMTRTQVEQAVNRMNEFHLAVYQLRGRGDIANVRTCFVDAAWMWDDTNNTGGLYPGNVDDPRTAAFWGARSNVDLVGIDLDAYANLTRYPDFTGPIANVIAFADEYGFDGWTVPELIHPRIATDQTGSQRAAWITRTAEAWADRPPVAVMFFDTDWQNRTGQVIQPGSPEFTAAKALG